ncbi:hypothetical protein [Nonomuraea bangladeshensis]|uniref:hypothetical protein n=1 Tax=Nonomuraea bangladeshensis TaxID=404385 RepID=UPI003C2BD2C6
MSDITPEKVAATPPNPENVAEFLAYCANDASDDGGNMWFPVVKAADGGVVEIDINPADDNGTATYAIRRFRAVVVEGDTDPIVLERPAELGIQWHEGGDLLALTRDGITLFPHGADEWAMSPANAREMAAHLAAMADAAEVAQAEQGGAS